MSPDIRELNHSRPHVRDNAGRGTGAREPEDILRVENEQSFQAESPRVQFPERHKGLFRRRLRKDRVDELFPQELFDPGPEKGRRPKGSLPQGCRGQDHRREPRRRRRLHGLHQAIIFP